jgi:hypothetical protein
VTCSKDSDCSLGVPCDFAIHTCAPSSTIQDQNYLRCILNGVASGIISQLKTVVLLPATAIVDDLYASLLDSMQIEDCIAATGFNAPYHSYHQFSWGSITSLCATESPIPIEDCPDYACDPGVTTGVLSCRGPRSWVCRQLFCYLRIYPYLTQYDYPSTQAACTSVWNCNYGGCEITSDNSACYEACYNAPDSFCGVCLNNYTCIEVFSF